MDNARSRFGSVRYERQKKNSTVAFQVLCPAAVLDPTGKTILYLEIVGSNSAVNGMSAALKTGEEVTVTLPSGERRVGVKFPDGDIAARAAKLDCGVAGKPERNRRASRKTDEDSRLNHKVFHADFDRVARDGFVPVLSDDPREIMFELANRLVLPVEPHWSGHLVGRLRERTGDTSGCPSFGLSGLVVQTRRRDIMDLISAGIRDGYLGPQSEAPPHLRRWRVGDLPERRRRWIRDDARAMFMTRGEVDVSVTSAAKRLIERACLTTETLVARHLSGVWGRVPDDTRRRNQALFASGVAPDSFTLASCFKLAGEMLEIRTERRNRPHAEVLVRIEGERAVRTMAA